MNTTELLRENRNGILIITFNHAKPHNPFNDSMQKLLIEYMKEAENDESVKSVILTGGHDRSFSVGGDFSEVLSMDTSFENVDKVLRQVMDLYIEILKLSKPLVTAIDHYAIGMGFQIAILGDYRLAADRAKFKMPEVKNGVACSLGGVLLEHLINRHEMMRICYECDTLPLEYCEKIGIVNYVCSHENLMEIALQKAEQYALYNPISFRNTKKVNNNRLINAIENHKEHVVQSHFLSFSGKVHQSYMKHILKIND